MKAQAVRSIRLTHAALATWLTVSSYGGPAGRDRPESDIPAAESTNVAENSRLKRRR
jgi:hypothetical protein